jgi:hypothetical protein
MSGAAARARAADAPESGRPAGLVLAAGAAVLK